jgi:multimeric flavodoxin WrbA
VSILFINGSPNKNGNTVALAKTLLNTKDYNSIHLVDYKLYSYGQEYPDDQFDEIVLAMKASDTIIIGSPVYWHNMSGAVRNLIDRFYGPVNPGYLSGRRLLFLFQGAAPESWMLDDGDYTMRRFAELHGLSYIGMATNRRTASEMRDKV